MNHVALHAGVATGLDGSSGAASRPTDADLLSRHVGGDPDAFGLLFGRHRDRLWAVAIRKLGDPEEAADALQDAMISAFRRAASFRGDSAVTTWLHRIVVNAALDRLRRKSARPTATSGDEGVLDRPGVGRAAVGSVWCHRYGHRRDDRAAQAGARSAGGARPGRHARLFGVRRRRGARRVRGHGEEQVRTGPRPAAPEIGAFAASGDTEPGSAEPIRWARTSYLRSRGVKTHNDLARQRRGHRQPRHGQPAAEEARVASHLPGCPQCNAISGQLDNISSHRHIIARGVVPYRALSCVGPSGKSSLSGQTGHVRLDGELGAA